MKRALSLLLALWLCPFPQALADGILVDHKTGKITCPHQVIHLSAEQAEEALVLSSLTLTAKQWQTLRDDHPTMPMRYIVFPAMMDDSVEEEDYAIQLSQEEAGIPFAPARFEDQALFSGGGHPTIADIRVDRHGQFYYGGVLYPFRKVLAYFSIQNQRQLDQKKRYKTDLESYQQELKKGQEELQHPAQSKWANPNSLKEYLRQTELQIQGLQRAIDAPIPAPQPLPIPLPFGMKPDAPAVASRLQELQAAADKAGWPQIFVEPAGSSDSRRPESAAFPEVVNLGPEQIHEVEIIGSLTLSTSQWEKVRKKYPFAHKRMWGAEFRMFSPTQAAVAKNPLQPDALGALKKYLSKSEGVNFPVDRRGQFYSGAVADACWNPNGNSLIPFQALLDAVRAAHREKDQWGKRPSFIVEIPPGLKSDSPVLKTRLDLLYTAAEKSGWRVIRSKKDWANEN